MVAHELIEIRAIRKITLRTLFDQSQHSTLLEFARFCLHLDPHFFSALSLSSSISLKWGKVFLYEALFRGVIVFFLVGSHHEKTKRKMTH